MKKLLWLLMLVPCILATGCGKDSETTTDQTTVNDPTNVTTTAPDDPATTTPSTTDPNDPVTPPETKDPEDEGALPTSIELDRIRVQLLSDRLVRIEVKGAKGFEDRASFTVQKRRGWDEVAYTSETADGYTVISTSAYKVYVPEDAKTPAGCYVTDLEGNTLWNYESNTNSNVYLPSPSDELSSWYFTDAPRVIPSENGYSAVEEYERYNGWDMSNDATDLFVFLPQGNYENFTSDFIELTGSSEMVTLKMLGYWDSRWYAYNEETALQQIEDYLDRGYSIDVLVIDTDWRESSGSGIGYDINKRLFPDMARFLEKAHEMGVDIVFNDHPEPEDGTSNLLDKNEVEYRNNKLKLILSLGLDYWWYDRNWHTALNPIHNDLSIYTTGQYAFQWITEEYYESITDVNEYARRALIMSNVDGILNGILQYAPELASHRYSIQWTGDINCDVIDLEYEIFNAIYGGAEMGLPYVSADIGGHRSEVSDDMYVRWMQFGALSPILRVHVTNLGKDLYGRMPWLYGETAEEVTHTYVDMRYRLLPLYYTLSHENYETGLPLVRRLDIKYPQYAESANNYQYLLGDTILVAPLAESYALADDFKLEADGKKGLKAEYFSNKNLSGTPVVTKYDENVYFDWGQNSPDGVNVADNFSIRWTGTITMGKDDACLRLYADDGVRVWIDDKMVIDGWTVYDQFLTSDVLKAGSKHSIKIEYFDSGSYAHIYMSVITNSGVDREVFIPDGEWMDVWTGKTYAGPATITVTHKLETSPIFVRMGAVLTLADNMKNVDEKDWSHMTLDVYPSISYGTTTTLYEDDTETVAYKDGHYRSTDITLSGSGNIVDLLIAAAKGTFEGDRAFTERNWTIRVHGRSDWGALTGMTLNGKAVEFTVVAKDPNADPLAIVGGCRDNVVYEVSFKASVTDESKLSFTFENTCEDGVNEDYDATKAPFTSSVETMTKADADVNLTAIGNKDWALFGAIDSTTVIRKNIKNHLIGEMTGIGGTYGFTDNYSIAWQDGDIRKVGSSTNGPVSNHTFELALKVGKEKTHYEIYLGGYKSVAKFTIRDRAGNVKTYTFGDMNTNYYRKVVIDVTAEEASEIYICYSMLCGDNITFSAVAASDGTVEDLKPVEPDTEDQSKVKVSVATPYTTTLDLTAEGTVYWEYHGKLNSADSKQLYQKAGATDIFDVSFSSSQAHWDNKAAVKWSDGADVASANTVHGLNGGSETITVQTDGVTTVKFLVGAWNAKNQMTIYDEDGIPMESSVVVSAGGDAQMALVTLDLSEYTGDFVTVTFTAMDSNGGNVSLTAVTAK
ncbi:MAG: DUF5110 domain-containing protein [Clostridia bacterium]|nr:DUF5110 domain-containing protein [Clostridia bacterium]